ncbi:prenyltransferase/squalene oxidase repeat-containing protein [Sinomonas atrocyanea]|uniref:prenyltransferase/squalene oxidase repeat-containing protein n=1 Tax=Sinomonas atrocyanea TaxID=37927 RepID=UPI003D954DF8
MSWLDALARDPVVPLLASGHPAVVHWTRRDLLGESVPPAQEALWDLPVPRRIVRHQSRDGSWAYPGRRARAAADYDLLETYRQLGFLVEMFGVTREHPALAAAAEYVLAHQSPDGDLRGIYGSQYSPNYTAGLLELLVKAGYAGDPRIESAFSWLSSCRQHDGGWALPLRTRGRNLDALEESRAITADPLRPSSHLITGVVLRAFAAHPRHRSAPEALAACRLLVGRFFEPDAYADRRAAAAWTEFSYPFWMTDLVSALDTVSLISPVKASEDAETTGKTEQARRWLAARQEEGGLFAAHLLKDRFHDLQLWFSLAVCRVFARMGRSIELGP